jgi:CheY-like chemotaxis protein
VTLDRSTITVLVVEDEALLRLELVVELQFDGYTVLEAGSGEEALIQLDDGQRIDVVITDIQLGGALTGWDVAEKFRADCPDMLVIYTSGNSVDHARKVSESVFFNKPYRTADIAKVCRAARRAVASEPRKKATGT